ncbi:MAG TPA: SEC-C metal-binding domain-containing protein, partial [Chitinophagaceae bacterium]|nr:SEC-C metal-binding domain-containing protein [Chitinophagaceae bacterium]
NAKQHAREATIVAEAGLAGAVTIATNMAGRGTDIKLGPGVKESGGLAIIGTERHESRRVDRQLRGRSGRQGDPGSSQFFVSLEDDLMRLFQSGRIASLMDKMGHKEGEVLQHSMITRSIERAQKKVEENNFGIRKRLLEFDDVMNSQRDVIYKRRRHALFGDRLSIDLDNAMYDVCVGLASQFEDNRDFEAFRIEVMKHLAMEPDHSLADGFEKANMQEVGDKLYHEAKAMYSRKTAAIAQNIHPTLQRLHEENGERIKDILIPFTDGIRGIQVQTNLKESVNNSARPVLLTLEKIITLALIDEAWKEHLRAMDDLRSSVQMASYEQKDPLLIYKFEGFNLFKQMLLATNTNIVSFLLRAGIPMQEEPPKAARQQSQRTDMSQMRANKEEVDDAGQDYAANERDVYDDGRPAAKQAPVVAEPKIGRNDPCPCGSGKKYKQCHGR